MSPHANKINTNNSSSLYPPPLKIHKDSHFIKKPSSSSSSTASASSPPLSSSSSSSSTLLGSSTPKRAPPQRHHHHQQQQRHPVIIYTHSPKIIHTDPRDFMALVQKLTGLSRFEDDTSLPTAKPEPLEIGNINPNPISNPSNNVGMSSTLLLDEELMNKSPNPNQVSNARNMFMTRNGDNDTLSGVTDDNSGSNNSNNNVSNIVDGGGGGGGDSTSCYVPTSNPYMSNMPVYTSNTDFLCNNSMNMYTSI